MRDLLVELLCKGAFADGNPLTQVVDGKLTRQRACCGDDKVFEYAARHCDVLFEGGDGETRLIGEKRKIKDI